ncbi:MAG: polysaccharide deacetylase [Ruminococcaceae bacterium]|nr:polysaccharide deacetylase [Oscillospiraceae bacterium]
MGKIVHLKYPGGKSKAFTISYDDGVKSDLQLLELMRKYGIRGTFNVNSRRHSNAKQLNLNRKHPIFDSEELYSFYHENRDLIEIAAHGLTHGYYPYMAQDVATWEVLSDRKNLETLLGVQCRGFAYPYGQTDDKTVEAMKVCGFRYARVVKRTHGFGIPEDPFRWECTAKHTDPTLMEDARKFVDLKDQYGKVPYLFSVWGHSYEFVDDDNWNVIEELFSYIGGRDDVWYCTNIEYFELLNAYRSLEYFADQSKVYNPTAIPVELSVFCGIKEWRALKVLPGETVDID